MSAPHYVDHHGSTVSSNSCSYATLSNYNHRNQGTSPPLRKGDVSGSYVVPSYGAPGYDTLSHGVAHSCSGYFDVNDAYKSKGGSCNTQFVRKLCQ